MALEIHLLGPARILCDGDAVELAGYRPLALLAYLILTRKAHPREHLIDLFFDGPDDPRAALRWTLSKLRKSIGDEYILTERDAVAFNFRSDAWIDVAAFEAGETDLYQGDLLSGLYLRDALRFEEWLAFERQRLRDIYQADLEKQLTAYKTQDDAAAVVITAQQLLRLDSLREDWHYDLIRAYARLGKRTAALEQYELCRQMLRREWGTEPAPEIARLAQELQSQRIPAAIANGYSDGSPAAATSTPAFPLSADNLSRPLSAAPNRQPKWRRSLPWAALGVVAVLAIILLAMSGTSSAGSQSPAAQAATSAATSRAAQAVSRPYAGKTVLVMAPFQNVYGDLFVQAMAPFEERTGIDVQFLTGNELYVAAKVAAGEAPDVVSFPQPGRLLEYAQQGKLVDLKSFMSEEYLQGQYPQNFLNLVTYQDQVFGAWFSAGLKSLVWYPKPEFEARGYEAPETWEELIALTDQIVVEGGTPWCIGIDDSDARGWIGTDWVEDILLRTVPPETYDAWVRHELPFDSPEIRRAFEIMGQIWLNDEYVYGGRQGISRDNFQESPAHLFEDPPGCYLHRQASFALHLFPPGVEYGKDVDFFYLPPIDAQYGKPVLGGGDVFAMFNDRPEVRELIRYLTTVEAVKPLVQYGGYISPHKGTPLEWYPTTADLRFAQILLGADTYRFDGSDMMPDQVGFGSFYRGITDWVEGTDLDAVLQEIDASWEQGE